MGCTVFSNGLYHGLYYGLYIQPVIQAVMILVQPAGNVVQPIQQNGVPVFAKKGTEMKTRF